MYASSMHSKFDTVIDTPKLMVTVKRNVKPFEQ